MATRSYIGLKKDNNVEYIYCHYDGYPSHHAPILINHYSNLEKVQELISLGAMSVLDEQISADNHSFNNPHDNTCVFYHRDRGEEWENNSSQTVSLNEYLEPTFGDEAGIDYKYLYDTKWHIVENNCFVELIY